MSDRPAIGTIGWTDLTADNADTLRDFYHQVTGWKPEATDMGSYNDYTMTTPDGTPVAGVCHARGTNAGLPPQWLIYINVADLDASLQNCLNSAGHPLTPIKTMPGQGRYCVIQDPAGAVCALFEPA